MMLGRATRTNIPVAKEQLLQKKENIISEDERNKRLNSIYHKGNQTKVPEKPAKQFEVDDEVRVKTEDSAGGRVTGKAPYGRRGKIVEIFGYNQYNVHMYDTGTIMRRSSMDLEKVAEEILEKEKREKEEKRKHVTQRGNISGKQEKTIR